ncbi:MAG TPA: nuclear transport factor 2 family protein [Actinomycetota bacterium]|jgi:ketosteroid isomerase-like protein
MKQDRSDATIEEVVAAVRRDMGAAAPGPGEARPDQGQVLAAVYRWFDAWNARDADAVVALMAERGGFSEPATDGPLRGDALAARVRSVIAQFPDLSFDLLAESVIAPNTAMAEWLLRGTDSTLGRTVAVPGIDVVVVRDGRVLVARRLFDRVMLYEQLGLTVVLMPQSSGD